MTKRTKDMRIKSLEEAKVVMTKWAKIVARIKLLEARAKSKIATINDGLQTSRVPLADQAGALADDLTEYITANRGQFKKPRKVKCDGGSFGLQEAKGIVITDESELMEHLLENGYDDCYEIKRTPIKKALEERLKAKCSLPGVTLAKGDTVVLKAVFKQDDASLET